VAAFDVWQGSLSDSLEIDRHNLKFTKSGLPGSDRFKIYRLDDILLLPVRQTLKEMRSRRVFTGAVSLPF